MGVYGLLPRILTVGRTIDLRQLSNGVVDDGDVENSSYSSRMEHPLASATEIDNNRRKRPRPPYDGDEDDRTAKNTDKNLPAGGGDPAEDENGKDLAAPATPTLLPPVKKKRRSRHNNRRDPPRRRKRRRKARIAVDASGWISRACHGHGASLLDERHLSRYGRAGLALEEQEEEEDAAAAASHQKKRSAERGDGADHSDDGGGGGGGAGAVAAPSDDDDDDDERRRQRRIDVASNRSLLEQEFVAKCARYVLRRVLTLRDAANADVLVVLDGSTPPCKASVVRDRRDKRAAAAAGRDQTLVDAGVEREGGGDGGEEEEAKGGEEKEREAQEARDVRKLRLSRRAGAHNAAVHGMVVSALLTMLREERIPFIVAPFEADGQLAHLAKQGLVDLVVTDDSDLVGHGVPNLLYKFRIDTDEDANIDGGKGNHGASAVVAATLLRRRDLGACRGLDLLDFSDVMLAVTLVAAGCDYCESLKGIGIVTARNVVKEAFHGTEPDDDKPRRSSSLLLSSEPSVLRKVFDGLYRLSYERGMSNDAKGAYEANFLAALLMYRHPIVFDPFMGGCVFANDLEADAAGRNELGSEWTELCSDRARMQQLVGTLFDRKKATMIAEGWLNPKTGQPYDRMDVPREMKLNPPKATPGEEEDGDDVAEDVVVMETQDDAVMPFTQDDTAEVPTTTPSAATPSRALGAVMSVMSSQNGQPQHSQSSVGTSSSSKPMSQPSSQPSHGSSNLSAEVFSPNLLPTPEDDDSPTPPTPNPGCGGISNVISRLSHGS